MAVQTVASTSPNAGATLANVDVISHLLFHKAILDQSEDPQRINRYLEIVKEGEHVSLRDPFDRSIALAFDLVAQGQLNVWDVDLVKFSQLYLKRAREAQIDLVTAGRIILMAWTVLKRQSDDLVRKFEERRLETQELEWDQIPDWNFSGEDMDFTQRVLGMRNPIDEKIWHEGDRPVTLMELVNAFEAARGEAEQRQRLNLERDRFRDRLREAARSMFQGRIHKEDLEEDIRLVWDRICRLNGTAISLRDLYDPDDIWGHITAFSSVLFLHRDRRIQLWQDQFPYGPVRLQNLHAPGGPVQDDSGAREKTPEPSEAAQG